MGSVNTLAPNIVFYEINFKKENFMPCQVKFIFFRTKY